MLKEDQIENHFMMNYRTNGVPLKTSIFQMLWYWKCI